MEKVSNNINDTKDIAKWVLDNYPQANVLALIGELGAGKTAFAQCVGDILNIPQPVKSPTFILQKSYLIPKHPRFRRLIHLDIYRCSNWNDLIELNLAELWGESSNLVLIEWAEKIENHLPDNTLKIYFEHIDENTRRLRTNH